MDYGLGYGHGGFIYSAFMHDVSLTTAHRFGTGPTGNR